MKNRRLLVLVALVFAVLALLPMALPFPLLPVAVILLCVAQLI